MRDLGLKFELSRLANSGFTFLAAQRASMRQYPAAKTQILARSAAAARSPLATPPHMKPK